MFTSIALLLATLSWSSPGSTDWPQWRGPARDGSVSQSSVPAAWPAAFKRAWRVDLGEGYSSPVAQSGKVFVHSRRDPDEVVTAVDLGSGKVVWEKKYVAPFNKNQYAASKPKGPYATPLVNGNRLFTLGASGVLTAWDTATGAQLWRNDYSDSVQTSKLFCGTSASPLWEDGSLIVQVGCDIAGGRILALDPSNGKERWVWKGAGPGYASPIVVTIDRARQIIALTEKSIESIDPKTGSGLWSIPFPDEWQENIVTPLWTGDHLVVSGVRQGTHSFKISRQSGTWDSTEEWKSPVTMYMSTPVVAAGTIYGHSNKKRGQLIALDAATGALRWESEGRDGDQASILLTPSHVLYLTSSADLVLVKRSAAKFEADARLRVAESETWTTPILTTDGIIIRDATGLARLTTSTSAAK